MPIKLKLPIDRQAIYDAIHQWLDLLAAGDYPSAYGLTLHDPYYQWTPELMESIVTGYGLPYEAGASKYLVTDWRTADGHDTRIEIDFYEDRVVQGGLVLLGHAYCEIPLNGAWSDLSAVFRVVDFGDGAALVLEEIRVL